MNTNLFKFSGVVLVFILIAGLITTLTAHAASFDCKNAQSKIDKIICNNNEVSKLDEKLGKTYQDALAQINYTEKNTLINEQKLWIKQTRNHCNDSSCLKQVYSARLNELLTISSNSSDLKHKSTNTNVDFCKSIDKILSKENTTKTVEKATNSRGLTKDEDAILQSSKLEFFDLPADYASGTEVLDIDNDKKQEVFAFNITGSERMTYMAAFDLPSSNSKSKPVRQLFSEFAGILFEPYFIQHEGKNFLVTSSDGSEITVSEIINDGSIYKQKIHCVTKTEIIKQKRCEHAACKALVNRIARDSGKEFTEEIWPHKYHAPFGLKVFTNTNPIAIDYDNTSTTRYLWKLGRKDYLYENIYWSWIGEGTNDSPPKVKRPESDTNEPRYVILGKQHENLRKVINQHEALLKKNNVLKSKDLLLKNGEFFFLKHAGLNYWVWGIGNEAAYGETMHIILTKSGKSNYIGSVVTKQSSSLVPCKNKCIRKLEN